MVQLERVAPKDRGALVNLMEKYQYDFSVWDKADVDENGLYNYPWIDEYFTEAGSFAYFVKLGGQLIGLVLVNGYPEVPEEETDFCLSEFFIMGKYRRLGYGRQAALAAFGAHHGRWQLKCHPGNTASVFFWKSVVAQYTGGDYRLVENYPNLEVDYDDGTPAHVFFFEK